MLLLAVNAHGLSGACCSQVMQPIATGSSIYEKTGTLTPVMVCDIRLGPCLDNHSGVATSKVVLKELDPVPGQARDSPRFELSADSRREMLSSLVRDGEQVESRANQLKQAEGSSGWPCSICTYINVTAKRRCGMCNKARASAAGAPLEALQPSLASSAIAPGQAP